MPPPPGCPDALRIPVTDFSSTGSSNAYNSNKQPPSSSSSSSSLPAFPTRLSLQVKNIEVQLPPLIAGALVAAFAKALADGLGNELLTHYYFPEQKVRINLDRVLDRLLAEFVRLLWDDLWHFYYEAAGGAAHSHRQVNLLFEGPIRQLVLILNGPETARCILDKIGPGLSRRPLTWSTNAKGIELPLALQLLCGYWHREFPSQSPGGSPDEIARTIHTVITTGSASNKLVSEMKRLLLSPNYVQMHLAESAIWDITLRRPGRPPPDGFHIVQFKFECQLLSPDDDIEDLQRWSLGSRPAATGSVAECVHIPMSDYIDKWWPKCGRILLGCLEEAVRNAVTAHRQGEPYFGMSVWDGTDGNESFCPGLRLIHFEVEGSSVRMSVSAWIHTLIEVFQQMCWMTAALSSSPFPGVLSECANEVSNWVYMDDNIYVDCSLNHGPVLDAENTISLQFPLGTAITAIASGFPFHSYSST